LTENNGAGCLGSDFASLLALIGIPVLPKTQLDWRMPAISGRDGIGNPRSTGD
jgi:hypothetical protein